MAVESSPQRGGSGPMAVTVCIKGCRPTPCPVRLGALHSDRIWIITPTFQGDDDRAVGSLAAVRGSGQRWGGVGSGRGVALRDRIRGFVVHGFAPGS